MKHLIMVAATLAALLTMSGVFANPADCGTTAERALGAGTGWTTQTSGATGFFSGVSCVNAADAWACGQNGTIVRTTDGGLTWGTLATGVPSDEEITDVEFVNPTHGWAIGVANAILHSTDGGTTWSSQSFLGSIYPPRLLAVSAVDASHAWIGAYETSNWMDYNTYHSVLLGTSDGTTWWSPAGVVGGDYGHGIDGLDFVDTSHGWAVADNAVTTSVDGGSNWTPLLFNEVASNFYDVSFADAQNGWVVGEDSSFKGFVMHTSDGGQSWYRQAEDKISADAIGSVNAVCAVSPSSAWLVCEGGFILHTTDAGATWVTERPTTQDLNDVSFISAETGWAVGGAGVILRHGPPPVLDTTPPTTSVSGADSSWHSTPVTLTLTAADNSGGSGVASTEYKLDAGAWAAGGTVTVPAPADHSGDGAHTLSYRSTDVAGNVETAKSVGVKIDTSGPRTVAKAARGIKGHAIALKYRISDNLSPDATGVRLMVKNAGGKVLKRFALGSKRTAAWYSVKWKPKAKGRFRYSVYARDLAGNTQVKVGSATVTVR